MSPGNRLFAVVRQDENEAKILQQFFHVQQLIKFFPVGEDKDQHIAAVHVKIQEGAEREICRQQEHLFQIDEAIDLVQQFLGISGTAGSIEENVHRAIESVGVVNKKHAITVQRGTAFCIPVRHVLRI